jgi:HK97 family phage portal protein
MAEKRDTGMTSLVRRAALRVGALMANYGGGVTFSLSDDERVKRYLSGPSAVTGHRINDESAMRVSTAFACVRTIAETVGEVTLAVYERQSDGSVEKVDHDLAGILIESPNADMNGLEFREAQTTNLAGRGNAYAIIERNITGNVKSLYPVPASRVLPKRKPDSSIVYMVTMDGKTEPYPADKIWHWKGFGYNGLLGLSPIDCARQSLGLSLAGEEFNARMFANGLTSSAIVSIPAWLKPEQRTEANKKLAEMHAGLVNAGKPYLLEGGMTVEDGVFAPKDAQFLELRGFQIPELCRIWRISPHMIAQLDRATNNNIEQLSLEFIMYTMLPYFRRIEEKARQLFKTADRGRFFVRFNFESLLRADSQARAQLYSILLQNGVFSRNEVRALENRNRVDSEGMDDYTVQSNMALLQLLETINKGQGKQP